MCPEEVNREGAVVSGENRSPGQEHGAAGSPGRPDKQPDSALPTSAFLLF